MTGTIFCCALPGSPDGFSASKTRVSACGEAGGVATVMVAVKLTGPACIQLSVVVSTAVPSVTLLGVLSVTVPACHSNIVQLQ